jgi:hypothetical protein
MQTVFNILIVVWALSSSFSINFNQFVNLYLAEGFCNANKVDLFFDIDIPNVRFEKI